MKDKEQGGVIADAEANLFPSMWYALHVRSRHEFKVIERLTKTGIETFLPVVEKLRKWKDRKKLIQFPLFPGYIFVRLPDVNKERINVLKTDGAVRFLGALPGEPEPVPDEQINSLKRLLDGKAALDPYPYLTEGSRVRIMSGPFSGIEGILIEKMGHHMLVISVDILRQGAALKVDASEVEKV